MKLSAHAFARFWDLHAWPGVLAALVLYVMFLTGSLTLFHEQFELWEEPFAQRAGDPPRTLSGAIERARAEMGSLPRDAWFYPPKHGLGEARIGFEDHGEWKTLWIDREHDRLVPERERAAHFIYNLHFLWHDLTGQWLYTVAGMLGALMLLVLVTGVLIHVKDLVRHFHQFRIDKTRRVLWSDMHKVLGVMGLPFQLLYAYTGSFIILAPLLLKGFVGPVFGGDAQRAQFVAFDETPRAQPEPGAAVANVSLDLLEAQARSARPDLDIEYFHLLDYGRENGVVEVGGRAGGTPKFYASVAFRSKDGALIEALRPEGTAASARRWINGLHYATFGGTHLRFLFFFLGLAGCATILTGNWIWIARRSSSRGNVILERLTAGVGAGIFVALAALLLASRTFPLDWALRGTAEELTFFAVFALVIAWSLKTRTRGALWSRPLAVSAALLLPVPIFAAMRSSAGLLGAGPHISGVVAVDLGLWIAAALFGVAAWMLRAKTPAGASDV